MTQKRILIIKLGALGDVIMSTGAIQAIRTEHPHAHIALLTTPSQKSVLAQNPYIDELIIDERKKPWHIFYFTNLYKNLQDWDRIYDLQNNKRTTGIYFKITPKKTEWNGIAKGCSHPQPTKTRKNMHVVDMLNNQLTHAGITTHFSPNISYLKEDISALCKENQITQLNKTVLLIPGCSAHRPMKRWSHYAALAEELHKKGYTCALIGTSEESELLSSIASKTDAINLCNKTSIGKLVALSQKARAVVGNDTGPLHIAAASQATGVGIFGYASDPVRSAPYGKKMHTLKKENIDAISPQEVLKILNLA